MGTRAIEKAPRRGNDGRARQTRLGNTDADLALGMYRLVLVMERQEDGWSVADGGNGGLRALLTVFPET